MNRRNTAALTLVAIVVGASLLTGSASGSVLGSGAGHEPAAELAGSDIHARAAAIGRGLNMGNALEAPNEGDWGMVIDEWMFAEIAAAGYDSVRIPIKWSAHAAAGAPYTIDPAFFERVDTVVDQAQAHGLAVIINMHHYDEIFQDPAGHEARFLALWGQIAPRYADRADTVFFEPLNEPHDALDAATWNSLVAEVIGVIRASNPTRGIIVGPHFWNAAWEIDTLELPESDRNLIATFHYYSPFEFTHQGAEWAPGSDAWLGTTWSATQEQLDQVRAHFDGVAAWAQANDRPVLLGEFGVYHPADATSRFTWTNAVRAEAEARGFVWTYWEFGAGFGAYDRDARAWIPEIHSALMPDGDPGPPPGAFLDVAPGHTFVAEIQWLVDEGVTQGCDPAGTRFCPEEAVTRGQMASFLTRALGLPDGANEFSDDDGSTHEAAIGALAAAGITQGCDAGGTRFCPDAAVTRGQMASFLARGFGLDPGGPTQFSDDDGSTHEGAIEALAGSGITQGCDVGDTSRFCPDDPVTRAQMAAFLFRALAGA